MAIQELNCATIGLLDQGRAAAVIDKALREMVDDLEDRGSDGKPRAVTIKLELTQIGEDRYAISVDVGTKRPGLRTSDHAADMRKRAGEMTLCFQEHDSEDPKQSRIEDLDDNR